MVYQCVIRLRLLCLQLTPPAPPLSSLSAFLGRMHLNSSLLKSFTALFPPSHLLLSFHLPLTSRSDLVSAISGHGLVPLPYRRPVTAPLIMRALHPG